MKQIILWLLFASITLAQPYTIMTEQIAPYNYEENGEIKGIGGELVQKIMKRLRIEGNIEVLPWARAYQIIQIKDDCILFSMSRNDAREKLFKWAGPLISNGVFFFKKRGNNLQLSKLEDAMNVSAIGVLKNDNTHQQLSLKGFRNLEVTPKVESIYHKLLLGRIDLAPASLPAIKGTLESIGKNLSTVENTGLKVFTQHLYIAFSLNVPDFEVARWQKALDEIKDEGLYQKIYEKYISE